MKRRLDIYARMTRHYRSGWRHLDNHIYVCRATLTKRIVSDECYDGSGHTVRQLVKLTPAELAKAKAVYALREPDMRHWTFPQWMEVTIADELSGSDCRHEHDCCGCPSSYAEVHQIKPREFAAKISVRYNY